MRSICPVCQSSYVSEIENRDNPFSLVDELLSPSSLSVMGERICKTNQIHPIIGAVAGTILASVINLARTKFYPVPENKCEYECHSCGHIFTTNNSKDYLN